MKEKQRIAGLVVSIAIIAAVVMLLENPFAPPKVQITTAEEGTEVGKRLPQFSLQDSSGAEASLSQYDGNLIINSWAAWCPFCLAEMLDIQAASDQDPDVALVFVHRTKTEPFSVAEQFLDDFESKGTPITSTVLQDPDDAFYGTFFGVGMPVTLFVDKDGIIVFKKVGPMTFEETQENMKLYFSSSTNSPQADEEIKTLPDGTRYIIHPDSLLSGGPPMGGIGIPIGIPAIAEGQVNLESAAESSEWLPDEEFGLGIVHKGESRFYPFRILVNHEIANDWIAGDPVLITYCPLCFTGIAFLRDVQGEPDQFGVSGKLYNSELVMYDSRTSSYWSQSLGKAIVGPLAGTKLKKLPTDTVTWGSWKSAHPETKVLSRDTGFFNSYSGINPYGENGNFLDINLRFPLQSEDSRLPSQEIVYGIEVDGIFKAYPKNAIAEAGKVEEVLGGKSVAVEWDTQLESASAVVGGEPAIVETLFWFAWAAFHPDTELYTP